MTRWRRELRRPAGRDARELRAPGHVRPTIHPNPAGVHEKRWGGVMCGGSDATRPAGEWLADDIRQRLMGVPRQSRDEQ